MKFPVVVMSSNLIKDGTLSWETQATGGAREQVRRGGAFAVCWERQGIGVKPCFSGCGIAILKSK